VIIDTVTQASSIATSAAQVFEGFSAIPVVGPILGGVAVAALITAFIAAKAKAFKAASTTPSGSFFKGGLAENVSTQGGYTGEGNPHEESRALGDKSYTYHKKEFVLNHELTGKHRNFFEALHQDKLHKLTWQDPTLLQIKSQVEPDPALPTKLLEQREARIQLQYNLSNKVLEDKLEQTNQKLDEAVRQLKYLPKETVRTIPLNAPVLVETNNHETKTKTRTHYPGEQAPS